MNERKNILMLIPNLGFGGAERSFSKLSFLLAARHNVYVAVFNNESYTAERYTHGGTFIDLEVRTGISPWKKISAFRSRIKKVKAIKKEKRIDTTISFLEGADYINILADAGDRKVLSIRGSKAHDPNIKGITGFVRKRILIPWLYNKADVIVCVNRGISKELIHTFRINCRKVTITEVYNFYDIDELKGASQEKITPLYRPVFEHPVIISYGRLAPEKGFDILIRVFAKIKQRKEGLKLVIMGEGAYAERLNAIAEECMLKTNFKTAATQDTNVYFLGYQKNPMQFLALSRLYVLTSLTEGFPNSLIEAMASGVAVAATDCPWGPRYILEGEPDTEPGLLTQPEQTACGLLLPLPSAVNFMEEWERGIINMLSKDNSREISNAFSRVRYFDRSTAEQKWMTLV